MERGSDFVLTDIISRQWHQVLGSSLSHAETHSFPSLLWGPSKDSHTHVSTHVAHGGRQEGRLGVCSLQVHSAAGSTEAPSRDQRDRWAGLGGLQAAGREEGRSKRPPWVSSGASRAPLSEHKRPGRLPRPGPLPFSGFLPQPSMGPESPASCHPSRPAPFPAQSRSKNAILIPQH